VASAIVPAAGAATRFGGDKLIAAIGDCRLLDCTLRSLLDAGVEQVVVVLPPDAKWTTLIESLTDRRVRTVVNPDPSRGMFSSIQCGVERAEGDPVLVLPADMPFVRSETITNVSATSARANQIVVPTHGGKRGHPVAFPASVRAAIAGAPPESTLKVALASTGGPQLEIPVDDPGVLRDVDVPSDL